MVVRLHTFLFADLVGFTRFTHAHGDELAADLATRFHERVCAAASELGCQVVKAIGDAVMVRSEDPAAAVTLARRILALGGEGGFPAIRVGLDTGPAAERAGDWFGSTVNTASRVTAAAGAGELLMTERTRHAAPADGVRLTVRGPCELKGLPRQALLAHQPARTGEACALA